MSADLVFVIAFLVIVVYSMIIWLTVSFLFKLEQGASIRLVIAHGLRAGNRIADGSETLQQTALATHLVCILLINGYLMLIAVYKLLQRVKFLAEHDSLTLAQNHRHYKERITHFLSKRSQLGVAII